MELKEFIANFANQFDETDASEFTAETKFKELDEWSSLSSLTILAMIDEEYNVVITNDDLRACTTVEDVYNFVNSKL
jgi:acyl carrier protein